MIDPAARYYLVLAQVSFAESTQMLRQIQAAHPEIEIPYADPDLPETIREIFDTQLYVPRDANAAAVVAALKRRYPAQQFRNQGPLSGRSIADMIDNERQEIETATRASSYFKIRSGQLRNKVVRLREIKGSAMRVSYTLFEDEFVIEEPISNLTPCPPPLDPFKSFTDLLSTAPARKAVIIDGNSELSDAMFAYNTVYSRDDKYVGGSFGFYFTMLRFRLFRANYELHVVFDGYGPSQLDAKLSDSDRFRLAYRENQNWLERFAHAAGFHLYRLPNKRGSDVIASLATVMVERYGYEDVLVATKNKALYGIVGERVRLSLPKPTSRAHPQTHGLRDAQAKFGLRDPRNLARLRAIQGDGTAETVSANLHNRERGIAGAAVQPADYLDAIESVADLADLERTLAAVPSLRDFVESGQFRRNLDHLSLDPTLLDRHNSLDPFQGQFDPKVLKSLMIEHCLYKEIEDFPKIMRIIRGVW